MAYTPEQRQQIALAKRLSAGYPAVIQRALLEAEGVESNFRNLNYGDRDSQGVLQQRPSQGWGAPGNPAQDVQQFLQRAAANVRGGFRGTAGQLAQAVQHSAFPGRYDQRAGQVSALLGGSPGVAQALPAASPLGQAPAGPGGQPARSALAQNLIAASQASAQGQTPDYSQTFALVAALKSPSAPNAAPIPVFAAPSVAPAKAKQAVQLAQHFLGTAYQWGGSSPKTGFDCSGLLQYVWGQQGVRIPRTSQQQFKAGRPVSLSQLRAGDAVFFHPEGGGPGHVGMMIDRSHFIEAPHTGAVVRISSIQGRGAIGARRFA